MDSKLLEKAGVAAHGERWKAAMAREMGVSVRFMEKLVSGDEKIPASFPDRILYILEKKLKKQKHIINLIKSEKKLDLRDMP